MTKQMPFNVDIEKSILSQMICESNINTIRGWLENLSELDFYSPLSRLAYNSIQDIVNLGKCPHIEAMSKFIDIEQLHEIVSSHATHGYMIDRIEELKELTLRRSSILTIDSYKDKILSTSDSIIEVEQLIEELDEFLNESRPNKILDTRTQIKDAVVHMTELKSEEKFVPYGLDFMDKNIHHARKQNHVLVASSGSGKTALALSCIAQQMQLGVKTLYFCRESESKELIMRLLSILTGIPFYSLDAQFHEDVAAYPHMVTRFKKGMAILQENSKNFHIYGKGDYTHDAINIRKIVRKHKQENGLDMIWVDYLQNMGVPRNIGNSIFEKVSYNSDQLDLITAEFDIASVVMCQLNRGDLKNKRPSRDNIKGSSDVENIAHWISILHCPDEKAVSDGYRPTQYYSDKTRLRGGFDITLGFRGECMSFEKEIVYNSSYRPDSLKPPTC